MNPNKETHSDLGTSSKALKTPSAKKIKMLLFDFGDVFINLDKSATAKKLAEFGLEDFDTEMILHNQSYEVGNINSRSFITYYEKKLNNASAKALTAAWNAILLDFPKHRLSFLKELKEKGDFQLILLSNTNDLHISWIKQNIDFYEEFKSFFDAFYLSHEINLRKPNANIYEFVIKKHRLKPEEVLFIDDTQENTDAAKNLGIKVWNINPANEDITNLFTTNQQLF
ncbi:HAD family phosphatase [Mesonia ostreae]|uniref:HAD family phosphatase n=1 Tax=Mesonia ostreae TaxID=861110 RepID=A0ABU2KLG2_9FLAO|nr:HAD family phosphatase [Mesonia ostreae]MDT0295562.1 HAD family phosphatase [Mesonia ostreae]